MRIPILKAGCDEEFPALALAQTEPDGLLCAGGDLGVERLLRAYRHGIFPWFNPGEPILWWSPNPRCIFDLPQFKPSRSLRRFAKSCGWRVSADTAFPDVITACAAPRDDGAGTWISGEMQNAYINLHELGHAHSIEAWEHDQLIGGLYGIAIGRVFFGESMFSRRSNASKVVLHTLAQQLSSWGFAMIDAQVTNPHLLGLGAVTIPREHFVALLNQHCPAKNVSGNWSRIWTLHEASMLAER